MLEYRRTQVPGDINSNVMRIIGDGSGSLPVSDPLNDLLAEQSLLDSQVADGLPEEARESLNLFADIAGPSKLRELDPEVAWEMAELDRLYPVLRDEMGGRASWRLPCWPISTATINRAIRACHLLLRSFVLLSSSASFVLNHKLISLSFITKSSRPTAPNANQSKSERTHGQEKNHLY